MNAARETQQDTSGYMLARDGERRFALMVLVCRHPQDGAHESAPDPDPSELLVRGFAPVGEEEDEKRFLLLKAKPQVWALDGFIELHPEAKEIDCEVRGDAGEIGSSRLALQDVPLNESVSTPVKIDDAPSQFLMLWKMIEMHEEGGTTRREILKRSVAIFGRYKSTGLLADISDAIATLRPVVETTPDTSKDLTTVLNYMGTFLLRRFDHTGDLRDVDEAIRAHRRAVEFTLKGEPNLLPYLSNLGNSLQARFERTGDLNDLTGSIEAQRQAVGLCAEAHADLPALLSNLGNSLSSLYETTGNLHELDQLIAMRKQALDLTPEGHASLPTVLSNLGIAFTYHFKRTDNLQDIVEAIKLQTQAVDLTPEGSADLPGWLSNLGNGFLYRFSRTGDLHDLAEAVKSQRRALDTTPKCHASLPSQLLNLGNSLLSQFNRTGQLQDLTEAIGVQTQALDLIPKEHGMLPTLLTNLGNSFLTRFNGMGNLQDLAEAIRIQKQAIDTAPREHADLPTFLTNLGDSYLFRFRHTGDLQDIVEGIEVQTRAVDLAPEGNANLPRWLTGLGSSYLFRFNRTGNLQDLAEAIRVQTRAIELAGEGHADLPAFLTNLGGSLQSRFQRTENLQDLAEAIAVQTRAVKLTPEGHADLPRHLAYLGSSYARRFEDTGNLEDIVEAIKIQTQAVELTPEGHGSQAGRLSNLGSSFFFRFRRNDDLQDIAEAIRAQTRAVSLTPEGHADLPGSLTNLAGSLISRFERTGDPEDIVEAIRVQTQAVGLTPDGHAVLPVMLHNLGHAWHQRYISSNLSEHLEEAVHHLRSAATSRFGSPLAKVGAAMQWARLLNKYQPEAHGVLSAFRTAIDLLPLIVGLGDTVQHRYAIIRGYKSLPLEASTVAFRLGRPDLALEWLEQGRCLVWGQQSQLHTPLDELRAKDSALAQRLMDVSRQLETAGASRRHSGSVTSLSEKVTLEDEAAAHVQLARMWDDLLTEARAIPGFETFLQPFQCSTILQHLPEAGAVVAINIHKDRCDAIALPAGSHKPLHVPLSNFTLEKAERLHAALRQQLDVHQIRARDTGWSWEEDSGRAFVRFVPGKKGNGLSVRLILEQLWSGVVKPILDALRFLERDDIAKDSLPRIWWCPTGVLSFLPLHAAGVYTGSDPQNAMDYVVSSYTPTVTALTQRVVRDRSIDTERSGLFLTCQPRVPGDVDPIPGTTGEVLSIYESATKHSIRSLKLEGDAVGPDQCLEYMEEFSSIHLACHASQNASDPLQSRFLFHKGKLTLNSIMQKNLKNSDLAFLSACKTSTGEAEIPDEAVHLAAGMLAAGYRRVVATMWSISDRFAPALAADFYEYLWARKPEGDGSLTQFDGSLSAYALHHALQQLRTRESLGSSDSPLLAWVPYVHFGY